MEKFELNTLNKIERQKVVGSSLIVVQDESVVKALLGYVIHKWFDCKMSQEFGYLI